ncbi:hypothetical protein HV127_04730 [Klebsiella sp. RHBSTW-00215]|uniref:HofO family protein n=1 Tax=Klebsiella sp. RHBSTW-00215 TaxID=2742640 RepID=UPI0015F49B2E|nr:hypothetical protein [Klebsiella sp. RHBSTW-00215]MBA7930585.1 hypothetical protein [Klebsiella sp. RHBSTW-00215]
MRVNIERWLTDGKILFVLSIVLALIVGAFMWPQTSPPKIHSGGSLRIQEQWRKLLPLKASLNSTRTDEAKTETFTPLDLPVVGAVLVSWRPVGRGGEMRLEVNWQSVPALFSWLARCGMQATAFSLHPEKQALQLTLQLEAEDAE